MGVRVSSLEDRYNKWRQVHPGNGRTKLKRVIAFADLVSSSEVAQHLEMGMQLLHRGAYQDALSHYHAAIEGDTSNYQSYYWR